MICHRDLLAAIRVCTNSLRALLISIYLPIKQEFFFEVLTRGVICFFFYLSTSVAAISYLSCPHFSV